VQFSKQASSNRTSDTLWIRDNKGLIHAKLTPIG
jgi:hypothetical protein